MGLIGFIGFTGFKGFRVLEGNSGGSLINSDIKNAPRTLHPSL